ncbi:hypothetical protein LOTGIDRAFT_173660 [Lottia gigantea]|uniref:Uncharacterized protein n=1 Tax=Lottia gigantea TaxID=225164 RepID=V4AQX8_LOTGI|nr:hypothetical protein LOTGIDRAFT_173660 [Lottia gigantea]ESO99652.1 hypothetical protein LOTGIDRAFT_173660 [Lottia gigantea]
MDWKEKKIFVNSLVDRESVKERTVAKDDAEYRRNGSNKYFLKKGNEKLQVCKSLFLSTLCLGEKTVYAWIANTDDTGIPTKSPGKRRSSGDTIKSDSAKAFCKICQNYRHTIVDQAVRKITSNLCLVLRQII